MLDSSRRLRVSEAILPVSLNIVTLRTILALLVLLCAMGGISAAHAQSAAGCKLCRDQHRACVQAHSQARPNSIFV
jgi:hypothetical protein